MGGKGSGRKPGYVFPETERRRILVWRKLSTGLSLKEISAKLDLPYHVVQSDLRYLRKSHGLSTGGLIALWHRGGKNYYFNPDRTKGLK